MCTTLSVAIIQQNNIYLGHVGDSRIYRLRDGVLKQLTKDHSAVQEAIDKGMLLKQDALSHPDRSVRSVPKERHCGQEHKGTTGQT